MTPAAPGGWRHAAGWFMPSYAAALPLPPAETWPLRRSCCAFALFGTDVFCDARHANATPSRWRQWPFVVRLLPLPGFCLGASVLLELVLFRTCDPACLDSFVVVLLPPRGLLPLESLFLLFHSTTAVGRRFCAPFRTALGSSSENDKGAYSCAFPARAAVNMCAPGILHDRLPVLFRTASDLLYYYVSGIFLPPSDGNPAFRVDLMVWAGRSLRRTCAYRCLWFVRTGCLCCGHLTLHPSPYYLHSPVASSLRFYSQLHCGPGRQNCGRVWYTARGWFALGRTAFSEQYSCGSGAATTGCCCDCRFRGSGLPSMLRP